MSRKFNPLRDQIMAALANTPKSVTQILDWLQAQGHHRPLESSVNTILRGELTYGRVRRTMVKTESFTTTYRYYTIAPDTTPAPEIK